MLRQCMRVAGSCRMPPPRRGSPLWVPARAVSPLRCCWPVKAFLSPFSSANSVGGRTRTIHAPGGYKFDIGPTFFLYPRVLKDIFEACGERLEDHVELKRLDPQYHLVFEGGGEIRATGDLPRLEQEIARLAPADARNVRRFLDDNREKLEAFGRFWSKPSQAPPISFRRPCWRLCRSCGLSECGCGSQALFRRSARAPRLLVPDEISRHVAVPVPEPVLDPLVSRIRARRLSSHRRLRRGVGRDGECRAHRWVWRSASKRPSSASFTRMDEARRTRSRWRAACRRLRGGERRFRPCHAPPRARSRCARAGTNKKLDRAKFSCSTYMLYLGIEGASAISRITRSCWHATTNAISERLPREFSPTSHPFTFSMRALRSSLAPKGHTSLYVLAPVPNLRCGIDWQREAPRYRKLALERLKILGMTDIEERIPLRARGHAARMAGRFLRAQRRHLNLAHNLTRCSISVRTTASGATYIWSVEARIPAADCPSSTKARGSRRACFWKTAHGAVQACRSRIRMSRRSVKRRYEGEIALNCPLRFLEPKRQIMRHAGTITTARPGGTS